MPGEWPIVILALAIFATVGGVLLRGLGLSRGESLVVATLGPLLVLVNIPLGVGGDDVRILANATGCLLPVGVGLSVVGTRRADVRRVALLLIVAIIVTFLCSRVVPSRGVLLDYQASALWIGALAGLLFRNAPRAAGAWAFAAAAIGTLIGADLLHLSDLLRLENASVITLGGAGLLDGILLTALASALVGAITSQGVALLAAASARRRTSGFVGAR